MSNLGLTDEINEKEKLTDDIKDEYKEDPIKEILVLKTIRSLSSTLEISYYIKIFFIVCSEGSRKLLNGYGSPLQ